jgi:hypothetical protein
MADFGLSAISTILSVVGTVGSVISGVVGANQQANLYNEQARAIDAQTQLQVQAEARKNRQIIGRNRAIAGAAGVDPFSGSPLETELSNAFTAGMNQAQIKYSGRLQAWNARANASAATGQIPGIIFGGLTKGAGVLTDWYSRTKGVSPLVQTTNPITTNYT